MMRAPSPVLVLCRHARFLRHRRHMGQHALRQTALHAHGICRAGRHLGKRRRAQLRHRCNARRRRGGCRDGSCTKDQVITEPNDRAAERKGIHLHARRQGHVAARRALGLRSERRLREPVGQAARVVVGVGRPRGAARRGAPRGRHPQAGRLAEAARRSRRYDRPRGLQDRETCDPARGRHRAAGAAVPARKARSRAAWCCTFTTRARRPTPALAAPSRNWSRPATPCWRSISAAMARRNRPPPDCSAPTSRTRRLPTCWAARSLGCGRKTSSSAPDTRRSGPRGGRNGAVDLVAVGNVGIPALHAAALEPELFHSVKLRRMLISWANIVH